MRKLRMNLHENFFIKENYSASFQSVIPNFFLAPWTGFTEERFFPQTEDGGWGEVSGWFKHITLIKHFISAIIESGPLQTIRY